MLPPNSIIRLSILSVLLLAAQPGRAGGVTVGDSTLIGTLDYSDTWTRDGSDGSSVIYPVPAADLVVEKNYGNPSESWSGGGTLFSINNDSNVSSEGLYPGGSGAGSSTGFTQTGGYQTFGFDYGLRTDFVIQSDFVMTYSSGGTALTLGIGSSTGNGSTDGLAVVFNQDGSIGLYNEALGDTTVTSLTDPIASPVVVTSTAENTWVNYAAEFNLNTKEVTVYANETDLGTIDLSTFDSGAYGAVLDSSSNATVDIGALSNSDRLWTDNFEVGAAPEPSTYALMLGGAALLVLVARFRKLA